MNLGAGRVVLILLTGLALLGQAAAPPASGQAPVRPTFRTPGEPVAAYLTRILRPALEAKAPVEDVLSAFYVSGLSDRTRAELSEDQFAAFWKAMAARLVGSGFTLQPEPVHRRTGRE